ncbi:MAG TPA: hypothetical protein VG101_08855 [Puia sp.]|jgi:hypothetical protein|nr:hypothetical protein [Puia sp.]
MKDTIQPNLDSFLKTCAIVVLIACLFLVKRNTPDNNNKPSKSPVHSTKDHNLQVGNA